MIEPMRFNLLVGWISMAGGALSGAVVGLFFYKENWMGGYASLRRRMIRLGHISFFGIGILNVLFAVSLAAIAIPPAFGRFASLGFATAAVTMPACCFLTAWKPALRQLFPIPVAAVLVGIAALIGGWL
jgi:hypothetical protein